MQNSERKSFSTKKIAYAAILIALNLVLTRFLSFDTQFLRISLGFVPTAVLSVLINPWLGAVLSAFTDILGYFLKPTGPYFPGFTVSAFLYALIYGLFFYKKKITLIKIIAANVIAVIIVDLCLNSLWLSILYTTDIKAYITARFIKCIIAIPIQIGIIYLTNKLFIEKYNFKDRL